MIVLLFFLLPCPVLSSFRPGATRLSFGNPSTQWKPIINPVIPLREPQRPRNTFEERMDVMLKVFQDKMDRILDYVIKSKVDKEVERAFKKLRISKPTAEGSGAPLLSSVGGSASISQSVPLVKETGYHGQLTRDIAPDTIIQDEPTLDRKTQNEEEPILESEGSISRNNIEANDAVDLSTKIIVSEDPRNLTQNPSNTVDLRTRIFVANANETPKLENKIFVIDNITSQESSPKSKRTVFHPDHVKMPTLGYNSLEHAPPDPLVALFLSHYGKYLPKSYLHTGLDRYRNIYSYAAANNIHNNMPFGSYKIYEDADK